MLLNSIDVICEEAAMWQLTRSELLTLCVYMRMCMCVWPCVWHQDGVEGDEKCVCVCLCVSSWFRMWPGQRVNTPGVQVCVCAAQCNVVWFYHRCHVQRGMLSMFIMNTSVKKGELSLHSCICTCCAQCCVCGENLKIHISEVVIEVDNILKGLCKRYIFFSCVVVTFVRNSNLCKGYCYFWHLLDVFEYTALMSPNIGRNGTSSRLQFSCQSLFSAVHA